MKKVISATLAILLVLSLFGCSKKEPVLSVDELIALMQEDTGAPIGRMVEFQKPNDRESYTEEGYTAIWVTDNIVMEFDTTFEVNKGDTVTAKINKTGHTLDEPVTYDFYVSLVSIVPFDGVETTVTAAVSTTNNDDGYVPFDHDPRYEVGSSTQVPGYDEIRFYGNIYKLGDKAAVLEDKGFEMTLLEHMHVDNGYVGGEAIERYQDMVPDYDYTIEPGHFAQFSVYTADTDNGMTVYALNSSDSPCAVRDCEIVGFRLYVFDDVDPETAVMVNGINAIYTDTADKIKQAGNIVEENCTIKYGVVGTKFSTSDNQILYFCSTRTENPTHNEMIVARNIDTVPIIY